jgi:hypothetical protein
MFTSGVNCKRFEPSCSHGDMTNPDKSQGRFGGHQRLEYGHGNPFPPMQLGYVTSQRLFFSGEIIPK